jgi:hypothetical protein
MWADPRETDLRDVLSYEDFWEGESDDESVAPRSERFRRIIPSQPGRPWCTRPSFIVVLPLEIYKLACGLIANQGPIADKEPVGAVVRVFSRDGAEPDRTGCRCEGASNDESVRTACTR